MGGFLYDTLENMVLNAINEKINKFYDEEKLRQEENKKMKSQFIDKIKALEKQKIEIEKKLGKTRNYLKSLYEDKVNGIITAEQFKDLIDDYNKNEDVYKDQVEQLNSDIQFYMIKEKATANSKGLFSKYQNLNMLNRVIVDEFIEKIYIGKVDEKTDSRNIKIKWNFE